MITVLVTGAGGTGGVASINALRGTTSFEVVAADMNPLAVGLYTADEKVIVPPARSDGWVYAMIDAINDHHVDAVVPLVDEELYGVEELREELPDTAFVAPTGDVIECCLDKYDLMGRLEADEVPVPGTWTVPEARTFPESRYPLVVKPRTGRGGRGVRKLESREDLEEYLRVTKRPSDKLLIQEYVDGREFTTSVVCTRDGEVVTIVPKEAVQKDRSTVHAVTRRESRVVTTCNVIASALQPRGPINVQQIVGDDGVPLTIEINPRFSSSACLTVAAGVNELEILIRDALGEEYDEPGTFTEGLHMLRYTDQIFVSDEEIEDGGELTYREV